jgi:hypothetical protein
MAMKIKEASRATPASLYKTPDEQNPLEGAGLKAALTAVATRQKPRPDKARDICCVFSCRMIYLKICFTT